MTLDELKRATGASLSEIRLSEPLDGFPEVIFDHADTLELLDLFGCGLSELPENFGTLKKLKKLFLSNNAFEQVPEVLAECPELELVAFKNCNISHIPEKSLPVKLRWLILTDNNLRELPQSLGDSERLQKCMLAGNQLTALPETMARCRNLELIRLSANQFPSVPEFLYDLPKLAWLAFSGNPFSRLPESTTPLPFIASEAFETVTRLGEGASGVISKARWITKPSSIENPSDEFALKAYKGAVTSDGFAKDELAVSLAAGHHENLVTLLAQTEMDGNPALAMSLIPDRFKVLGGPPSLESCTRDVFEVDQTLSIDAALSVAKSIANVMSHLRQRDICHNDLYAHNILADEFGQTLLTDFGAAATYASLPKHLRAKHEQLEVRAFGCLVEDLLGLVKNQDGKMPVLERLKRDCLEANVSVRPLFEGIKNMLDELTT